MHSRQVFSGHWLHWVVAYFERDNITLKNTWEACIIVVKPGKLSRKVVTTVHCILL